MSHTRRFYDERCDPCRKFWLIFVQFGCHGNSLGSRENLDGIFEFADPKNPTIHAKIVSMYRNDVMRYASLHV